MNADELRSFFPNASADTIRRNTDLPCGDGRPAPKLERHSGDGAVGQVQVQARTRRRFLVRIEAVRTRLLDEDNLCEKYHVDLLRYSGIISGDEAGTTRIETRQRKAHKDEKERIIFKVYEVPLDYDFDAQAAAAPEPCTIADAAKAIGT